MKLSVSLVFFVLVQHGLSAPTGRHPDQDRPGLPSLHEFLNMAPTSYGSSSSSAPAGRHPDQDPHSAGHASGPSPHKPCLPPLLEHLGMNPTHHESSSSSRQRTDSLQDHQEQDLPPPGQHSSRKKRKAAHFGCSDTSCDGLRFVNLGYYGRHLLSDLHSRPSSDQDYVFCTRPDCKAYLYKKKVTRHMNTAHDIHIVNHEQDLPPPGQDSQPNRSGKRRRKAAHASHFGCSDTSCEDIRVGDSKKYGRHLLDVHAEASSNERYVFCKIPSCKEYVGKHALTRHMKTKHKIEIVDHGPK